jgi:hypothetical protein
MAIDNQVSHRRKYFERLEEGKIDTNPVGRKPAVVHQRPQLRPGAVGRDGKPLSLGEQMGLQGPAEVVTPAPHVPTVDPANVVEPAVNLPPSNLPPEGGELPHPGAPQGPALVNPPAEAPVETTMPMPETADVAADAALAPDDADLFDEAPAVVDPS